MNLLENCTAETLDEQLSWLHEPESWHFGTDGLRITPTANTDFFRPYGGGGKDNAALLYTEVTGDFTATARASAELSDFGDAAALTVRSGASRWAKLCIERSPIGEVSIVSVVTNGASDDANSELLSRPESYLRITRKGNVFGMHYSIDGSTWRFVRTFAMEVPEHLMVGIHAQSPFGSGCVARFGSFDVTDVPVADFRSGE